MINQVVSNNVQTRTFSDFKQPQNGWYLNTNKKEENHKWGKTIAISALVVGFGTMAIMKGAFPKKAAEYLGKIKVSLEKKVEKGGKFASFYKKSLDTINSFLEKSQSINNITSLKDILFQKFMYGTTLTKKVHEGITKLFKNIGRKTVNSSYAKTNKKFAELNEYLYFLNEDLIDQKVSENIIKSINDKIPQMGSSFDRGFGSVARTKRLAKIDEATKDLSDYMWNASYSDIKNFKSKNMYQTFIAEEKMQPFKASMSKDISTSKKQFYDSIENIMSDYKKILTDREYKKLESKVHAVKKSLDKSIENETTNYIDKARDLKLGSAPTDILSILGSVGVVGWYLGKSDNKDEKISASLKYGIPAIGAIVTSLLCTAKLIAGTKSMAIGLLSGWVMSKIGSQVDYLRKQYTIDISLQSKNIIKPQSDKV